MQELPAPKVICHRNFEETFACSWKAGFRSATFYELELIEGISDGRAAALVEAKESILKQASLLAASEKYKAFQAAHGIGERTALMLSKYLLLE
ncbi:MAG: hypothetical protein J5J00_17315 [Deltaproteobacteria bacterium]|nr:hypothetical protein [Deltaproteobacteria bacterium]